MLKVTGKLHLKLSGLANVKSALRRVSGPVKQAVDEAARVYTAYILKEFDKNSRGSGKWKKLKPATALRKKSTAILVDTRALRTGLNTSIKVKITVYPRLTVVAEFTGRKRHPKAKMTIADLASIHHLGLGRVPQRKILVSPDRVTTQRMSNLIIKAAAKVMKGQG